MTNKTEMVRVPRELLSRITAQNMFSLSDQDYKALCALLIAPAGGVRAVVDERSPADYAIEHAEFLATSADGLQDAYQAYSLAQMNVDEGGDDGEEELTALVDSARDDLHEALLRLRSMTYEFRKRSARVTPQ